MSLALIAFLVANSQCKTLAGSPKILLGFLGDFSIGSFLLLLLLLLLFNILFFFPKNWRISYRLFSVWFPAIINIKSNEFQNKQANTNKQKKTHIYVIQTLHRPVPSFFPPNRPLNTQNSPPPLSLIFMAHLPRERVAPILVSTFI